MVELDARAQCEAVDPALGRCTLAAGHPTGAMYTFGNVRNGHQFAGFFTRVDVDPVAEDARAAELLKQASDAAEADKRGYQRGVVEGVFPRNAKVDVIWPDGTHRYWSTHCRHDRHEDCSATEITGPATIRRGVLSKRVHLERPASIERRPAQCKTCASPCICDCHKEASDAVG
jgi:hypothetical protein